MGLCVRVCPLQHPSPPETAPLEISKCGHGNEWWLDIGLDEKAPSKRNHIEMALTTQREESLRCLYVALTRARHQVHIMVSGTKLAKYPRLHTVSPPEEPPSLNPPQTMSWLRTYCRLWMLAAEQWGW